MNEPTPITQQRPHRALSREVQNAEQQIATVDEQLAEMQKGIDDAELQIDAMNDEVRSRERFIKAERKKMERLANRRAVFIEASAALRKLERP